jgi:predicted anti-sigma-YlaC factor YlaD
MNQECQRYRKALAREGAGENSRRRSRRLEAHLGSCPRCLQARSEFGALDRLGRNLLAADALSEDGFRSVVRDVRAARPVVARQAPATPLWAALVPAAALVAVAGLLIIGGSTTSDSIEQPVRLHDGLLTMSPLEDTGRTMVSIKNGRSVYRVAVSNRSNDFSGASRFEVVNGQGIDPTPDPRPGEVLFYRVE